VELATWIDVLADLSRSASKGDSAGVRHKLWRSAAEIHSYLRTFRLDNAPEGFIQQYVDDTLPRFLRTLEFIPLPCSGPILEVGANPYLFQLLLRKVFPKAVIEGCNYFDHNIFLPGSGEVVQVLSSNAAGERYSFTSKLLNIEVVEEYPYRPGQFDLILFCETLEHLIVNPLAVFSRLRRILRPGGHLLITLPNAVRLTNVALILEGRNFYDIYSTNGPHGRHNREYTLEEMVHLLKQNGYQIDRAETWDRFDYDLVKMWSFDYAGAPEKVQYKRSRIMQILESCGGNTKNRGDNLYLLARNPE
jgi:SAM-dependent methyltransferase